MQGLPKPEDLLEKVLDAEIVEKLKAQAEEAQLMIQAYQDKAKAAQRAWLEQGGGQAQLDAAGGAKGKLKKVAVPVMEFQKAGISVAMEKLQPMLDDMSATAGPMSAVTARLEGVKVSAEQRSTDMRRGLDQLLQELVVSKAKANVFPELKKRIDSLPGIGGLPLPSKITDAVAALAFDGAEGEVRKEVHARLKSAFDSASTGLVPDGCGVAKEAGKEMAEDAYGFLENKGGYAKYRKENPISGGMAGFAESLQNAAPVAAAAGAATEIKKTAADAGKSLQDEVLSEDNVVNPLAAARDAAAGDIPPIPPAGAVVDLEEGAEQMSKKEMKKAEKATKKAGKKAKKKGVTAAEDVDLSGRLRGGVDDVEAGEPESGQAADEDDDEDHTVDNLMSEEELQQIYVTVDAPCEYDSLLVNRHPEHYVKRYKIVGRILDDRSQVKIKTNMDVHTVKKAFDECVQDLVLGKVALALDPELCKTIDEVKYTPEGKDLETVLPVMVKKLRECEHTRFCLPLVAVSPVPVPSPVPTPLAYIIF